MAHAPNLAKRAEFNRTVHGARGLFAGIVLLYHVVNSGLPTWPLLSFGPLDFFLRASAYGVELFFCISGFVIVGTLRRARDPLAFMEDRLIRIYPVLWTSIFVIVGLGLLSRTRGYGSVSAEVLAWLLPVNLLGVPGVVPWTNIHPAAWSLSYELVFYGICAIAWALRRHFGLRASLVIAAPLAIGMILLKPRAMFFLSGVCVAFGLTQWQPVARLARYPAPFLIAFLILWRLVQDLTGAEPFNETTLIEWTGDWRAPLAALAFLTATIGFAGIAAEGGVCGRLLQSPSMQFMGTVSYSFYLWHPIIMAVVKQGILRLGVVEVAGQASQLLFLLLSLPPSLVVASFSQRVLERGAGSWLRRRLHHRVSLVALAAPAVSDVTARTTAGSGQGPVRAAGPT